MTQPNNLDESKKLSPESIEYLKELDNLAKAFEPIRQQIRDYIWDLYAVDGLSPKLIRSACEDALRLMEAKEKELQ